jgi:hypothetical protein
MCSLLIIYEIVNDSILYTQLYTYFSNMEDKETLLLGTCIDV